MRLDIHYRTRFAYAGHVSESQNELRACPAIDDRQQLVHYDVRTTPSARVSWYLDYWGTRVDTFGIRLPHTTLEVVAEGTVDTVVPEAVEVHPRRAALTDPAFRDEHLELLQPSPHVALTATIAEVAHRHAGQAADDVVAMAHAVHEGLSALQYAPGATYVGVPVDEVLRAGGGVCQDFAHVAVAMYRSLGGPARYVSGYLFTGDDATGADTDSDEVEVQTHAWVEVAVPGHGWYALDPTNRQQVSERHVTIGRGRDYDDVAPLRGVFLGPPEHELEVDVRLRRLAVGAPAAAGIGREPSRATLAARQRAQQQQQQQQQQQ